MTVYLAGSAKRKTLLFQPGIYHPEIDKWMDVVVTPAGLVKVPKSLSVVFNEGVAEVDHDIGRYLLKHGLSTNRSNR